MFRWTGLPLDDDLPPIVAGAIVCSAAASGESDGGGCGGGEGGRAFFLVGIYRMNPSAFSSFKLKEKERSFTIVVITLVIVGIHFATTTYLCLTHATAHRLARLCLTRVLSRHAFQ